MHILLYLTPVILFLLLRKKKPMPEQNKYRIEKTLKEISEIFGTDVTKNVEKIYRLETRNFSSGQFLKTYSAGMESHSKNFPYGWTSLKKFWTEQPHHKPVGKVDMKDAIGMKSFLKFPSLFSAMFPLAFMLQKRGNDVGTWFSNDEAQRQHYRNLISKMPSTITDKIKKS